MINIENLHVNVEEKEILKGINLDVKPGELHVIMGRNGTGKSSLANVLAGKERYEVTEGSITYQGKNLLDMTPEDVKLPAINDVLLLRHARRLPFEKRGNIEDVERQHKENPIDSEIIWKLVEEIQDFIDNTTLNPDEALQRGSFG